MFKLDLEKAEEPEIKLPKSIGSFKKQESSRKTSISALLTMSKPLTTKWKILKDMAIPDHLSCLLTNLCEGQEATVSTGHGTTDWFQIGEGVCQGCILLPYLFNLYAEHIMWNARLGEAQGRIKTTRRNINNLRYAEDTTLMAESEEELKSLLMKVKVKVKSFSRVRLFVTPWTVSHQAPPSMGFSRQEYWSGLPWWRWKREWKSWLKTQHSEN